MDERSSTTTGLGSADTSRKVHHSGRLHRAALCIEEAAVCLGHKETHETRLAKIWLEEARFLVREEAKTIDQGQQGREGVHGEDTQKA